VNDATGNRQPSTRSETGEAVHLPDVGHLGRAPLLHRLEDDAVGDSSGCRLERAVPTGRGWGARDDDEITGGEVITGIAVLDGLVAHWRAEGNVCSGIGHGGHAPSSMC